jgi:hypothetical protein
MVFKVYLYGAWKKEIRKLLQKRLALLDKIRYHKFKANKFESEDLPKVEEELNKLLKRAGNKI